MASFDYRLNPLYAIKECSFCGALYTANFCCSKGGLEDKILCLNEGWYTIHDENKILNNSESSNDNTNVVSAPQEPFVFNQDPGDNTNVNVSCPHSVEDIDYVDASPPDAEIVSLEVVESVIPEVRGVDTDIF
ncbi:hypothetical protein Tco_0183451 [Tanacetum coccineum]